MTDLTQLLAQFEREEFAASHDAQLPETRRHAVRRTVVRARRVRSAATIAVAAVAVVACGTGAWALSQVDRNEPALPHPSPTVTTSSPSPSPTPSPSATAEPTLTMPAFTGDVTVDPQLPTAQTITPEAWNAAGPGWVLATYREEAYHYDEATQSSTDTYGPHVAYLVSPEGVRYQLTGIRGDAPIKVVEWVPGSQVALAIAATPSGGSGTSWVALDLVTGETRPITASDVTASSWARPSDDDPAVASALDAGVHVQDLPGFEPLLALPERHPSSVTGDKQAAITTAQSLVPAGEDCTGTLALSTTVVVECGKRYALGDAYSENAWFAHFFVYVAESGRGEGTVVDVRIPHGEGNDTLGLDGISGQAWSVGDTVIAMAVGEGLDPCPAGRYSVTTAGATQLPGVASVEAVFDGFNIFHDAGVVGSSVYTVVTGGCSGSSMPDALVRDDIESGTYTTLIPLPQSFNLEAGGDDIVGSIESAYVVGSRP